jgi:integrase
MSIYKQKGSPLWWLDVTVEGQRYRRSTKTTRITLARAVEAEFVQRVRERGSEFVRPTQAQVLRDFSSRFLEWVNESALEKNTKKYYTFGWRLLKETKLANMRIDQITTDDAGTVKWGNLSPAYTNQALRTLSRMLSKAKEWKLIRSNPKIKKAKEHGREKTIDAETEAKLLAKASKTLRDVIIIIQDSGMRPEEVFRIRWEDVRWSDSAIFIPTAKTEKGRRYVPISNRMMDVLLMRCKGQKDGWVFPSSRGSKTGHIQSVAMGFRAARKRADVDPRIVLYSARHTYGSFAMAETKNVFAVADSMGHVDLKSMKPYQHHCLDEIREAVNRRNEIAASRHNLRHSEQIIN